MSKALWVRPGPVELLEALGIQGSPDQLALQVSARLGLLRLAPPAQQELERWVLVELLAQLALVELPEQWAQPDRQAALALKEMLGRLDLISQETLVRQETPAVRELWERVARRDRLAALERALPGPLALGPLAPRAPRATPDWQARQVQRDLQVLLDQLRSP